MVFFNKIRRKIVKKEYEFKHICTQKKLCISLHFFNKKNYLLIY